MQKNHILFLALIIILSLILGLVHLFDKEFGTDEKLSIKNAENFKNFSSFKNIHKALGVEVNPPLFFMLLSLNLRIVDSIVILKRTMLFLAILSIMTFYLMTKEIFGGNFALLASFLYTINPMHVVLSQHIRAYILLCLT